MLIVAGDFVGVHKSSVSKYMWKVLRAIASLRLRYVYFPNTEEEVRQIKTDFYAIARFPKVVGALDCTHVKIISPGGEQAEMYRNRKGFFSYNVQAICDARLKIRDVVARWPGSVHHATIFSQSAIKNRLQNNPGALADS
ncbi:hypothetical protein PPYR_15073, partial [Photinus pyralis]